MAGPKEQKQVVETGFPYEKYRGTDAWKRLDIALGQLEANQDIELTTARELVIGYMCEALGKTETKVSKLKKPSAKGPLLVAKR